MFCSELAAYCRACPSNAFSGSSVFEDTLEGLEGTDPLVVDPELCQQ